MIYLGTCENQKNVVIKPDMQQRSFEEIYPSPTLIEEGPWSDSVTGEHMGESFQDYS